MFRKPALFYNQSPIKIFYSCWLILPNDNYGLRLFFWLIFIEPLITSLDLPETGPKDILCKIKQSRLKFLCEIEVLWLYSRIERL